MKPNALSALLCSGLALFSTTTYAGKLWSQKTVIFLQTAPTNAPCIYFQLVGVTAADNDVSPSPYFAIHESHPGYKQAYAMLLAAKLSDTPVRVTTTGTVENAVCGNYVGVHEVQIE